MVTKVIMLNPKAVKMFLNGTWEARGRPTPLILVTGNRSEVKLSDAISGAYLGGGHLSGSRDHDGDVYYDANTSEGVRPRGVGYGLALYSGLALQAAAHYRAAGVSSPDGGGAVDLWDEMVATGLAEGNSDGGEEEDHEDTTDVDVDVSLPSPGRGRYSSYSDMLSTVRSNLDIPDDVDDDDIEIELESETVEVSVTVRWKTKGEGGYFLPARHVDEADFMVAAFDATQGLRSLPIQGKVPPDLLAAMPIASAKALRNVVTLLQQLGWNTSVEKMLQREDLQAYFQTEGKQMMIPGVPAHYPRPAAWKAEQVPLPGMNGLGGGKRRGLGDLPRGFVLSARAQGVLHRFGDVG